MVATIVPGVSDHNGILVKAHLSAPVVEEIKRHVFAYAKADWTGLCAALSEINWTNMIGNLSVDEATETFAKYVMNLVYRFIPNRKTHTFKSTHPWLNETCRKAIREKIDAINLPNFNIKRDDCTNILRHAFASYVDKTREKLIHMKPSSKQWWKMSNSLLMKSSGLSSIPPLKTSTGWVRDSQAKADTLASTFTSKSILPDVNDNEFTLEQRWTDQLQDVPIVVTSDEILGVLTKLNETSGTGPDALAARVLKKCWHALAHPIALFATKMLSACCWLELWQRHWIHPIHKRNSRADYVKRLSEYKCCIYSNRIRDTLLTHQVVVTEMHYFTT